MEVVSHLDDSIGREGLEYDRAKEVKEFDETKAGVKGLVDAGLTKVPRFLIHPQKNLPEYSTIKAVNMPAPVIDLQGFEGGTRTEMVGKIRQASETWGFFWMVNHGIPDYVGENMLEAVRQFHEQPKEEKIRWYSRDPKQRVKYYSNGDLLISKAASWRDSISFEYQDGPLTPQSFPSICREAVREYVEHLSELREKLSTLLSEALGLSSEYLESIECMKTATLVCHYYPVCPEPDMTLGATKHSDPSAFTILLQDNVGGLQVFHQNQWVDVPPVKGGLVAHIGDLMQLITNDKFKSVEHRVLVSRVKPRVSAASFFYPSATNKLTPYAPIKELLSDSNAPIYRETHITEYLAYYRTKGSEGTSALPYFKLEQA